jgi:fumarate reductase (CoM/CoB) subunit A
MIKEYYFDIIVLGAGGAGCTAAITAARNGASVALVSKEAIGMGNTRISGGWMASSGISEEDSPEILKEDMIKGGEYLNNIELVDSIAKGASSAIRFVESLGSFFRRDEEGILSAKVAQRLGGHRFNRSFVNSGAGISISRALRNTVANIKSISVLEDTLLISLFREDEEIRGALAVNMKTSDCLVLNGKTTILATGGCGWLYYPQTTNNRSATGDGYAIAFETGAQLVDIEMLQFIPFAMNHPVHLAGSILGDPILAGPKGKLINGLGEVVAGCDINRMTRAQVTALMAKEISAGKATKWGGLELDLSGNSDVPEMVQFKKINDEEKIFEKVRIGYGEDAFNWKKPWHVSPSAHYMLGGVKIDSCGHSSLKNLYAVGEVSGGVMGANRLGSTSLTEIFVRGIEAGKEAARFSIGSQHKGIKKSAISKEIGKVGGLFWKRGAKRPIEIKKELQRLMIENAGIVRDEKRLSFALSEIDRLETEMEKDVSVSKIRRYNTEFLDAIELRNMLTCARMIATCAQIRKESRGAHLRLDYQNQNDANWLKNITIWKEDTRLRVSMSDITTMGIYKKMEGS